MANAKSEPKFYTVQDVAAMLKISEHHTLEMIHRGHLLAINIAPDGRRPRYRIPQTAIDTLTNPSLAGNLVIEAA